MPMNGNLIRYGYIGASNGPFVLYDPVHFDAVLAHAESVSASLGYEDFAVDVPAINRRAIIHLLLRKFRSACSTINLLVTKVLDNLNDIS